MSVSTDDDDDDDKAPLLDHDTRTLAENYSVTDIADEYCRTRLDWYGFETEQYGKDDRHNTDEVTYGGRPDLRVTQDDEAVGYVEVKTKRTTSADWYGRLNKHHWEKYLHGEPEKGWDGANTLDKPVWIFMSVVDESQHTIVKECVIPVREDTDIQYSFSGQGGKQVIQIASYEYRFWPAMITEFNAINTIEQSEK